MLEHRGDPHPAPSPALLLCFSRLELGPMPQASGLCEHQGPPWGFLIAWWVACGSAK